MFLFLFFDILIIFFHFQFNFFQFSAGRHGGCAEGDGALLLREGPQVLGRQNARVPFAPPRGQGEARIAGPGGGDRLGREPGHHPGR